MSLLPRNGQQALAGLAVVLLVGLSWCVVDALTARGIAFSTDSLAYREVARNFLSGHGISLTEINLAGEVSYQPMTIWPPLYPLLLSAVAWVFRTSIDTAAIGVAFAGHALSTLLVFFVVNRFVGIGLAVVTAAIFALDITTMTVFSYMWSEAIFIPLVLAALYCAICAADSGGRRYGRTEWAYLLASFVFVVLASYTRFIGVIFALMPITAIFRSEMDKRLKIQGLAVLGIGCGMALLPLLLRNLQISGYLSGSYRRPVDTPFSNNLGDLGSVMHYHFDWLGLLPSATVIGAMFVVVALVAIDYLKKRIDPKVAVQPIRNLLVFAAVGTVSYLGFLLALRSWKDFDSIDTRLLSPAAPMLLILFTGIGALAARCYQRAAVGRAVLSPWLLYAVFSVVAGIAFLVRLQASSDSDDSAKFFAVRGMAYSNLNSAQVNNNFRTLYRELRGNRPVLVIFSDRARILGEILGLDVRNFPTDRKLETQEIDAINHEKGNAVIILFSRGGLDTFKRTYGPSNLTAINQGADVVVVSPPLPEPKDVR